MTCRTTSAKASSARAPSSRDAAGAAASRPETWSATAATTAAAAARTFRGKNHLEKFVGVFKKIPKLVALRAEGFCRELRGDLDPRDGRIFGDVTDFIDFDARLTGERGFQLFGERSGFGIAAGKSAHEASKLGLRQSGREVNAGNSGARQELRETFFTSGCAEGHTVQQNLVSRSSQQEAATDALIKRTSKLFPRSLKLRRRAHVAKFIEPREFQ